MHQSISLFLFTSSTEIVSSFDKSLFYKFRKGKRSDLGTGLQRQQWSTCMGAV